MKAYKLVSREYTTYGGAKWEIGKRIEADASQPLKLCTSGVIHSYEDPLVAVLMNPAHANIDDPRMLVVETHGRRVSDGTKQGHRAVTPIEEIDCPTMTTTQRVAAAILCAKKACSDEDWNAWADKWLSGEDRTAQSAYAVAYDDAAAYYAHVAARAAARAAALAAVCAADVAARIAAYACANVAGDAVARAVAAAAVRAYASGRPKDFVLRDIVREAMKY